MFLEDTVIKRRRTLVVMFLCEWFENTNGILRSCQSKEDRQYNGKGENGKRTNNDLQ